MHSGALLSRQRALGSRPGTRAHRRSSVAAVLACRHDEARTFRDPARTQRTRKAFLRYALTTAGFHSCRRSEVVAAVTRQGLNLARSSVSDRLMLGASCVN